MNLSPALPLDTALELASDAARAAGVFLLEKFEGVLTVDYKDAERSNPASEADRGAEQIILTALKSRFPDHSYLSEETGKGGSPSDYVWVVDPLDGTVNFLHGYRNFCVSIGLTYRDEVVLGVIYNPFSDELFTAVKGSGASLNGKEMSVSKVKTLRESLVGISFPYGRDSDDFRLTMLYSEYVTRHAQAMRRDGSTAMALANVACGRFDGFCVAGNLPWDYAAGTLLVSEAGGRVSDFAGQPFSFVKGHVLATNGLIHASLVDIKQDW